MTPSTISRLNISIDRCTPTTDASTPEHVEAAKALIISVGSRICALAGGRKARAVVLTGSMSRDEATLKREGANWRVLGDATFLVILDRPAQLCVAELQRHIEDSLLARGVICKVVVVTSTRTELCRMKPHIYAYELRERGVVLWGDPEVLHLIPQFSAGEIPKEDGWWLLCNRIIEQLESAAEANSVVDNGTGVRYRIAKLYLAMTACYLLTIGQYRPTYRDRAARLQELAQGNDAVVPPPIPVQRFSRFVSQCTELKLQGDLVDGYVDFPRWHDAVADAEVLWRWTLACTFGLNPNQSRKDLLAAVAARQPIFARAKGWVRAAYVCPLVFSRHCLRWSRLACSMSPRYLVYRATSELFFTATEPGAITATELATIVATLPLTRSAAEPRLSWGVVAMLVAHNFHLLLESNRS